MDVMHSCRCCLRCPPDKDLTTPYTHLGKTEIYVDMLKDCFDLQLTLGGVGSCGICSMCVGRLRDASDFKMQVQRSQVELQGMLYIKVEPIIKEEPTDEAAGASHFSVLHEVAIEKPDYGEFETGRVLGQSDEDPLVKSETSYSIMSGEFPKAGEDPLVKSQKSYNPMGDEFPKAVAKMQAEDARNLISSESSGRRSSPVAASTWTTCRVGRYLHKLRAPKAPSHKDTSTTVRYQCHDCGRYFSKKTLLRKHIHKMHTGITYKCSYCHYNFKHKSVLKEHELSHTGEKPFQCTYCNYKSRHNSYLKTHIMIHTGEKPFSCDICDYKCRREVDLRRHKMKHTGEKPYECSYCDFKCSDLSNLRGHEMAHTEERPFKCTFCDYTCRRRYDIKVHQRRHTGEKPIQCSHCEYSCRHKNSLRLHYKAKHPGVNF